MNRIWTEEILGSKKPIIAMCHLMALPGDPSFDKAGGMKKVIEWARKDLLALQNGGVDAVMFSNEFSMPYMTRVEAVTITCMARIIGELIPEIRIPFGVNALWDPIASLDLAIAVNASFIREVFTGVYAGDYGFWNPNCGAIIRHQYMIGAEKVKLLFNIVPESASYIVNRDIGEIARSTVFNTHPDALCVSGISAGAETNTKTLESVKNAVPESVVFANTGVRLENFVEKLSIADGAVVGTTFKVDGKFENHVDENRVKAFMDKVKEFRKN
jgi:uncharacterized protein